MTSPMRPRFLGPAATPAQLIRATAANHAAWMIANASAGGEVRQENGVTWVYTPQDEGEISVAFPELSSTDANAILDMLIAACRRRKPKRVAWWSVTPARPRDLGARLAARGFEWGWQPHWMALDLQAIRADFPMPDGLHIAIDNDADWDVDDLPYYSRAGTAISHAPGAAHSQNQWHFGAWLNGCIVGHSLLQLTTGRLGVAGIYAVGVIPSARNQGIGRAVTLAACQFAQSLGCHWATLNAATHIYDRMGFVSLGRGQTWFMHAPILDAHPPTPTQVAFAEAVGRGDTKALTRLAKQDALPQNLNAPLLCGHTPIELAVKSSQPASAEWLAAHGATLEIVQAWDLGWCDRIPALLAAAPKLINHRSGAWQITPLHQAINRNDIELIQLLLTAAPDLNIQDTQFHATPLGWARHFQRPEIIALLENYQASRT